MNDWIHFFFKLKARNVARRERLIYRRCTPLRTNAVSLNEMPFARSQSTWKTLYLLCFCDISFFECVYLTTREISSFIIIINFSSIFVFFFFNLWITLYRKKRLKKIEIFYSIYYTVSKYRKFFDHVTHRWVMPTTTNSSGWIKT